MGYGPRENAHLQRTAAEGIRHSEDAVVPFGAQLQVRLAALVVHRYAVNSGPFKRV